MFFAVFTNPQRQQFLGIGTSLGKFGQLGEGFLDLPQNVVRFLRGIVLSDIVVKLVEIMCGIINSYFDGL